MKVIYDDAFSNMVKACILKEVKGYEPATNPDINDPSFVKASDYTLNELFIEWDWVKGTPHDISGLELAVSYALRHRGASHELIFSIISQALEHGVDYVLTRRSYEAKRFCNMVYTVRNELREAKLNMKFIQDGKRIIGRYFFSHKITDLLLQFYQKRFPEKQVVISNIERTYIPSSMKIVPQRVAPAQSIRLAEPVMTLQSFL